MEKSEIVDFLKDYLEQKSIDVKEIELPKMKDEELSIQMIKQDPLSFSFLFISFYNEFRNNFKECPHKGIQEIIMANGKFAVELMKLKNQLGNKSTPFGKSNGLRVLEH
jgi:hypothetical protein